MFHFLFTLSQEVNPPAPMFLHVHLQSGTFVVTTSVMSSQHRWHLFCAIVISQWGLGHLDGWEGVLSNENSSTAPLC